MAKIYVSSTFSDLRDHRLAVYHTLRQLRHDVVAMEDYVATDQRPVDKCLADVAACDVLVLLLAWRYGYVPPSNNPLRQSITELEYRQARLHNKPCLVFLHNPDALWQPSKHEVGDGAIKLQELRADVQSETTFAKFDSIDDLAKQVAVAVASLASSDAEASRLLHNLPRPMNARFIGRGPLIDELRSALSTRRRSIIVNVHGMGGVGKSALVLHVAHDLVAVPRAQSGSESFQAIIWFSAKHHFLTSEGIVRNDEHHRTLNDLLATMSITLEREDIIRARSEDQIELARNALGQQRTLLLLDNFETMDPAVANFMRELPATTKVIITSRTRFGEADKLMYVGAMTMDEAVDLVRSAAEEKSADISPTELLDLERATGYLPVAITWSVAQVAHGFDVDTIVRRLRSPDNDVVRFCFEGVMDVIRGTPAHHLLMALSIFASDTRKEDVAAVAGLAENPFASDQGFVILENLSLMTRSGRRVGLLPLARDFAQLELACDEERDVYIDRWKTRMIHIAAAHRPVYWYDFNAAAVQREADNLRAALEWAQRRADWAFFLSVVSVVCWYDNYIGLWNELIETAEDGVRIASETGHSAIEAELRAALLGFAYSQRGEFEAALITVQRAIDIYRDVLQDNAGLAFARCHLAQVYRKRGDMTEAESEYAEAAALLDRCDVPHRTRIAVQFELGKLARDKGRWEEAKSYFREVRGWLDDHPNDPLNQTQLRAAVLGHLALVRYFQGDYLEARSDCVESLNLFSALNLRVAFGPLFWRMALIDHALGDHETASESVAKSITWFSRLAMPVDLARARELEAEIHAALREGRNTISGS